MTAHLALFAQHKPDIITITDNYLTTDTNPSSFPLPQYKHRHIPDVTVYYKDNLHTTFLDIKIPRTAACTLQIHNNEQKTDPAYTILNIYRRPRTDTEFIQNLQNAIDTILTASPRTDIIIQGDFNINLFKLRPGRALTNLLIENNLYTTITTPTRYNTQYGTSTLIDPTLTTLTRLDITAGTISPPLSDHLPTLTVFHTTALRQTPKRVKTLSTHRYEKHKPAIIQDIHTAITEAREKEPHATTDRELEYIQQAIQTVIERHGKRTRPRRKPWCAPTHRRQIRKQHKLHARRLLDPTPANIAAHKACQKQLKKAITLAKRQSIADRLDGAKDDIRLTTRILKSVTSGKARDRTSPTNLIYEGKTITDPTAIANALNDFFITVGHKTSQTLPRTAQASRQTPPPDNNDANQTPSSPHPPFTLRHITIKETTKTMNKINRKKASDIYKIKPTIIRDLTPMLAPILTRLFNQAIDGHRYPDTLKLTKVIELFKKINRSLPKYYRPISLLPIIAKLFDTLLNNQIMHHLTTHNIISPTQYAFRPNSNTTLALQTIVDRLHKHMKQKQPTLAIYIDLSKAYDTVSHKELIHKLRHHFNFSEHTTAFFATYFQNRRQSTHTQHAQSDIQTITHGIPQGSTLSTTFFLLYINDIIKTVPLSTVYTYADDTTLIISSTTPAALQLLAQSELTSLIQYFHDNNLVPNPSKTQYSIFHPQNPPQITLTIQDTTLEQVPHAPLLGMTIQKDLKHTQTITNIIRKLQPTIQDLRYANKLLPTSHLRDIYLTHIYPHLISNVSIWGTADTTKTYIKPLIRTHKKIIRLIMNRPPGTHTAPLMARLKLLNPYNLYTYRVCVETHPFIHLKKDVNRPEHNHNYIPASCIHDYPTRHAQQQHYYIPNVGRGNRPTQKHKLDFTTERNTRAWNEIPLEIRTISGLSSFKTTLKQHLLDHQV